MFFEFLKVKFSSEIKTDVKKKAQNLGKLDFPLKTKNIIVSLAGIWLQCHVNLANSHCDSEQSYRWVQRTYKSGVLSLFHDYDLHESALNQNGGETWFWCTNHREERSV